MHRNFTYNKIKTSLKLLLIENKWAIPIIIAGVLARIILAGQIPPGLNQDEASIGYDAYSIMKYGIDRNGISNPIHLIAWGSGQNALYAYLAIPFIALFGLNVLSIRAVNIFFGIISLIIFFLLAKNITNKRMALISLFLLAISPWHIMASRWALESNLFPAFMLLSVYFIALSLKKPWFLPASALLFALSLYAYGTSYFAIPVFLALVLPYLAYHRKLKITPFLLAAAVFTLVALPIFLFVIINNFQLETIKIWFISVPRLTGPARFSAISSVFSRDFISSTLRNIANFIRLVVLQSDVLMWNSIPGFGYIYLFSLPFIFIGVWNAAKSLKENKSQYIMLAWLAASVLTAFITEININRINIIFIPLIYFTALGIDAIFKNHKKAFISLLVVYITSFLTFCGVYFTIYSDSVGPQFFESLGSAIKYASEATDGTVYITDSINMPYIYVLFYTKTDPYTFLNTVEYLNPGDAFQQVASFGRYRFGPVNLNSSDRSIVSSNTAYILENNELDEFFKSNKLNKDDYLQKAFKNYTVVSKRK